MKIMTTRKRKRIIILIMVVVVLFAACAIYLSDYYHADMSAIEDMEFSSEIAVESETWEDGTMAFAPEAAETGLIFYPGGKVEYLAYQPLMQACAAEGILCVLVEMPFNLAVLDMDAADGIQEKYPEIEEWYIGGHSLGGSMAASYVVDHVDEYEGLVLLGSYSTAELANTDLNVISIYGSEDEVLNSEKYEKNRTNLPADFTESVIEGGCHAYFGVYGHQEGDGTPTISNQQQIEITAQQIADWMAE